MASEYRVVPFVASVGNLEGSKEASAQLEALIHHYSAQGLEYVRLENVTTVIAGTPAGCFGSGGTSSQLASYSMIIFRK